MRMSDWSSDVCSSDLVYLALHALHLPLDTLDPFLDARVLPDERARVLDLFDRRVAQRLPAADLTQEAWLCGHRFSIGSASCRERVCQYVLISEVAVSSTKNN